MACTVASRERSGAAVLRELHVGTRCMFAAARLTEVSRPILRRVVLNSDS